MGRRPDFVASSVFHDRFGEAMLLVLYHPDLVEEYRVPPKQSEAATEPFPMNCFPSPAD
jgi:hypothetical protein